MLCACAWLPSCTDADADTDAGTDTEIDSDTDTDADTTFVPPENGLTLVEDGRAVQPDASWRSCEQASDCLSAASSCDGCCAVTAIDVDRADDWRAARDASCAGYEGSECDCDFACGEVDCVDNLCEWTATPETTECDPFPEAR